MSAWTLIEHRTVGSGGTSNITFSSIPQTYTDLILVASLRSNRASITYDGFDMKLNNTTSNFSWRRRTGFDNSVDTGTANNPEAFYGTADFAASNTFGNGVAYIPNYTSNTTKIAYIDSVTEHTSSAAILDIRAFLWTDNSAVSSIVIASATGNTIQQYSSATLYGVTRGSSGGVTVS